MDKINILLNWESSRADLMEPFIKLANEFNFSVIWYASPPAHNKKHPFEEYYFGDYKTPYELLKKVKPRKIIFFGIHSFPQIALNIAAKNLGITTYTMHHGIFSSNLAQITQMRRDMGIVKKRKLINNLSSIYFYFSALQLNNLYILHKYIWFPFLLHKYGSLEALKKCVYKLRLPDRYIQLSPHNAIATKEIDNIKDDTRFHYIGHPAFDNFLANSSNSIEKSLKESDYWLLIDFPNIEGNIGFKKIGKEAKFSFYKRLSKLAQESGCRLKIKLHPAGYESLNNYQDENIDLITETDIISQIHFAKKCFSFYSTLLIPIVFIKQHCVVFDLGLDIGLQRELVELGVVTKVNLTSFSDDEITGDSIYKNDKEAYQEFVNRYLYLTDGKAINRLKEILESEVN